MKGVYLTWDRFQELNPSQTAVVLTYSSPSYKPLKVPFTRVLLGGFPSREEAWDWCKRNDVRRKVTYRDNNPVTMEVKLLRLSKLIREYAETHPKRVSAIKLV